MASWNGQQYFISFIDDYSRYDIYTSLKRSLNHWTCSRLLKLRLRINSIKELKSSDLTIVVNTMTDMTDLVNIVQVHLLNT